MSKRRHRENRKSLLADTPEAKRPHGSHPWPRIAVAAVIVAGLVAGGLLRWRQSSRKTHAPIWKYEIVDEFSHDIHAFTQGLTWDEDALLEGTGRYGESELRRVELASGKVRRRLALPDDMFGEGVAVAGDEIFQLTWKRGVAIVYDKNEWKERRRLSYEGQGWGITYDGTHLITSDGSSVLKFRRPDDFHAVRQLQVLDGTVPIGKLNELEYIDGRIFANIWYRDRIAVIDPASGRVEAWIDLSSLWPEHGREQVLNGIAYDPRRKRIFVTGKNWPRLFQLKVEQQ